MVWHSPVRYGTVREGWKEGRRQCILLLIKHEKRCRRGKAKATAKGKGTVLSLRRDEGRRCVSLM